VHALDEAVECNEAVKQPKADKEKINIQPDCETKRVPLDAMVLNQTVVIGCDLSADEEANLSFSSRRTKMCSHGPPKISQASIEASSSTN
jgi:hypothetical protein